MRRGFFVACLVVFLTGCPGRPTFGGSDATFVPASNSTLAVANSPHVIRATVPYTVRGPFAWGGKFRVQATMRTRDQTVAVRPKSGVDSVPLALQPASNKTLTAASTWNINLRQNITDATFDIRYSFLAGTGATESIATASYRIVP